MKKSTPSLRLSQPMVPLKGRARLPVRRTVFLPVILCLVLALAGSARAQVTYGVTNLFTIPTGTGNIFGSSTADRGMAYDAVSNLVYVSSVVSGGIGVLDAYDGTVGTLVGSFSTTGLYTSGTFANDQIGVAADGAIYVMDLATSSSALNKIYRYPSWNSAYTTAFSGNALANGGSIPLISGRIGDSLTVTGSGTNTLILAGVATKPVFVLFSTLDGTNFTSTIINVPSGLTVAPNVFGLCFYTNNTFLIKPASSSSSTAYLIQFPTNFATQTVVTGTVVASTPLGTSFNNTTMLDYTPSANFLAAVQPGTPSVTPTALLGAGNIAGGISLLVATNIVNSAGTYSSGNATGGAALGGNGLTNVIYVMNTGNSLLAYKIISLPPVAPIIVSPPAGATAYLSDTLSATVSGTHPFSYFWQASTANSATSTFTNIPGANTNTLTITSSTNYYQLLITNVAGSVTSSPVQVTILTPLTNSAVASLWQVAPGAAGYSFLPASGDNTRGIAYDTNSQRVVVAATSGLFVLNGNNGTNIESLNISGLTFGGLLNGGGIGQVVIADDGAVYAGNVTNNGGALALYRWSAPSNSVTATSAFSADPGSGGANADRWGDSMAVRGSGAGTQILLGSRLNTTGGGTNVALLTPNDGVGLTYQSMLITISGVPANFAINGVRFGAGNTFWAKSYGGDLFEIAFNTNTQTGSVIFDYKSGSQIASAITGVGIDPVHNLMAGINLGDTPNDLQLFELTGTADSPVLFDQAFFASANANLNQNAAITVKYPRIYALDVNNGVVALTYGVPATTAPAINTPPASTTVYTNIASVTFSVSASGSVPLYYQWQFNSNNINGATSSVYTVTSPTLNKAGYYSVAVHNISGSVTSAPALLTLIAPVLSPQVTPLWSIGPGTNGSYLTTSGYETRGLAYDPTTTNLLVADHYNIHVYSGTNGGYLYDVNTTGLPTSGTNGWVIDQIGVAADGTLYSANLSPDGTGFSIISYAPGSYSGANYAYGGASGGSDLKMMDPAGDRWGDTMAVRGSGTSTEILLGSYNGTNVALFTTMDGSDFEPIVIPVQGVPAGFAASGIAFGPGNTFYGKGGHNYDLRQVSVDTNAFIGTVVENYIAPTQIPNDLAGIAVDVTNNILGGVCLNDAPNDVQLYLLSGNTNSPYLFDQDFFPANNPNSQDNGVVTLFGGLGFALDVNNGIVAFNYSVPTAPAVTLTSVSYLPGSATLNWNNTFTGHGYQVVYKTNLLDAAWIPLGAPVTTANATASYTDNTAAGATRFYRIISE